MIKPYSGTPTNNKTLEHVKGLYMKSSNCHPKGGRVMLFVPKPQTRLTSLGMAHIKENICDIYEPYHTENYSRFRDLNLPCFPISTTEVQNPLLARFWTLKKENQEIENLKCTSSTVHQSNYVDFSA